MKLSEANVGSYKVIAIYVEGAARARLAALGIKKGVVIRIVRFSPKKGAVMLCGANSCLALRRETALCIEVTAVEN